MQKNASVVVRRVPGLKPGGILSLQDMAKKNERYAEKEATVPGPLLGAASSTTTLQQETVEGDDENARIAAVIGQAASAFDNMPLPWNQRGRHGGRGAFRNGRGTGRGATRTNRGPVGVPGPNYVCHRCNKPGHWIAKCPTNGDPAFDRVKVRPPTGIPRSMLRNVDAPEKGTGLQDSSGQFVTLRPNEEEFARQTVGLRMSQAAAQRKVVEAEEAPAGTEPIATLGAAQENGHFGKPHIDSVANGNPRNEDATAQMQSTVPNEEKDVGTLNESEMASKQIGENAKPHARHNRNAGNGRNTHASNLNSNRANHFRSHQHPPPFPLPPGFPPGMMPPMPPPQLLAAFAQAGLLPPHMFGATMPPGVDPSLPASGNAPAPEPPAAPPNTTSEASSSVAKPGTSNASAPTGSSVPNLLPSASQPSNASTPVSKNLPLHSPRGRPQVPESCALSKPVGNEPPPPPTRPVPSKPSTDRRPRSPTPSRFRRTEDRVMDKRVRSPERTRDRRRSRSRSRPRANGGRSRRARSRSRSRSPMRRPYRSGSRSPRRRSRSKSLDRLRNRRHKSPPGRWARRSRSPTRERRSPPRGRSPARAQSPVRGRSLQRAAVRGRSPVRARSPRNRSPTRTRSPRARNAIRARSPPRDRNAGRERSPPHSKSGTGAASPRRGRSPLRGRSPGRGRSPARGRSPVRARSPRRGRSPARGASPGRGRSPGARGRSPARGRANYGRNSGGSPRNAARKRSPVRNVGIRGGEEGVRSRVRGRSPGAEADRSSRSRRRRYR